MNRFKISYFKIKFFLCLFTGVFFFISYGLVNNYTSTLPNVPSFFFAWEKNIPFIEWMIIPYMSSDLLFIGAFILCHTKESIYNLSKRVFFCNIIAILFFFIQPLVFTFEKPEIQSQFLNIFFEWLKFDKPYNQNPSLHIALGTIKWLVFRRYTKGVIRCLCNIWFVLIALSTLTVYQHHFIDLIGGAILAIYAVFIFPLKKRNDLPNQTRFISSIIYTSSLLSLILVFCFKSNWSYLFLYPCFSFFRVGLAYHFNHHDFLLKRNGCIPVLSWIMYMPYLLSTYLVWCWYCSKDNENYSIIQDDLFIGRRPFLTDSPLPIAQDSLIIDLAPELTQDSQFKNMTTLHFPILDLAAPNLDQLIKMVQTIDQHGSRDKYVHCALGYSRSVLITAALLIKRGFSVIKATQLIKEKRKKAMFIPKHMDLLYLYRDYLIQKKA